MKITFICFKCGRENIIDDQGEKEEVVMIMECLLPKDNNNVSIHRCKYCRTENRIEKDSR